jgi:general stress protein 26
MLTKVENLLFLENKIQEIKMAMFRAETDSELQLPNNIITTIKTDSEGNIWFFTSCYGEYVQNIDQQFFACLDYYQKGQSCVLRLSGRASIIEVDSQSDTTEVETNSFSTSNIILIKFKILHAEYFEKKPPVNLTIKNKVKTFFTDIFIPGSHRMYDFS